MEIYNQYDRAAGKMLMIGLSFQLSTNFLGALMVKLGLPTILSTYLIYGNCLAQLILIYIKFAQICALSRLLLVYILSGIVMSGNFILVPSSQIYFRENMQSLLFIFVIYVPIAHLVTRIRDWTPFIETMKTIVWITPVAGVISYYFLEISKMITYMMFSNMILPGLMMAWYCYKTERRIGWLAAFIVDFFLITIFGGRMSMLSALIFVAFLEFYLDMEKKRTTKVVLYSIFLVAVGMIIYANLDGILHFIGLTLERIGFHDSYIARMILRGKALQSSSRNLIYENAWHEIKNMGLHIYGLFGDRLRLDIHGHNGGYTTNYVHNIVLELLLSFGWVFGMACIAFIGYHTAVRLHSQNTTYSMVVFYFCCVIFLKLMVSSSFLVDGQFSLIMGVLCNRYYRLGTSDYIPIQENRR